MPQGSSVESQWETSAPRDVREKSRAARSPPGQENVGNSKFLQCLQHFLLAGSCLWHLRDKNQQQLMVTTSCEHGAAPTAHGKVPFAKPTGQISLGRSRSDLPGQIQVRSPWADPGLISLVRSRSDPPGQIPLVRSRSDLPGLISLGRSPWADLPGQIRSDFPGSQQNQLSQRPQPAMGGAQGKGAGATFQQGLIYPGISPRSWS